MVVNTILARYTQYLAVVEKVFRSFALLKLPILQYSAWANVLDLPRSTTGVAKYKIFDEKCFFWIFVTVPSAHRQSVSP